MTSPERGTVDSHAPARPLSARLRVVVATNRHRWLGPFVLAGVITVFHFAIDPHEMFWHDFLRRAYYLPIVWAVYLGGLRGGAIASSGVAAIFAIHLVTGWGDHLGSQLDQMYDIVGYLALGLGVGYVLDRARRAAVVVAQREWEVSLRSVVQAAVRELKEPHAKIAALAGELTALAPVYTWEHSVGVRLRTTGDTLAGLRRDLSGIAKILSCRSPVTRPFDWAQRFANDPHLGGHFGLLAATIDPKRPPPLIWAVPSPVLDEVVRCLLAEAGAGADQPGIGELVLAGTDQRLVIEYHTLGGVPGFGNPLRPRSPATAGEVRQRLMELCLGRLSGTIEALDDSSCCRFRLTLDRPRVRLRTEGASAPPSRTMPQLSNGRRPPTVKLGRQKGTPDQIQWGTV